jgi:GTP-binding protein
MIPSRGIIGLRSQILTATEGEAIMSHRFIEFQPWKGEIGGRHAGALIAMETGQAYAYSIDKLQDRGSFYIEAGDNVYAGQVIGEHIRQNDLVVNVCKSKKLTNMRASGSDEKMRIAPAIKLSLEEYMELINKDEYLEITPLSLRLRKILLDENDRKRANKNNEE